MMVGSGLDDVAGLQLDAATRLGELDDEDLRTIVVFLAHYAGWPRAAKLNTEVEKIVAQRRKAAAKDAAAAADTDAGPVA
jgi:4-carboxymuconolactone decarboxylase